MLFQGSQKGKTPVKCRSDPSSPVEELRPISGQLRLDATGQLDHPLKTEQPCQMISFGQTSSIKNALSESAFTFNKECEEMDTDTVTALSLPSGQLQIDSSGHLCAGLKGQ